MVVTMSLKENKVKEIRWGGTEKLWDFCAGVQREGKVISSSPILIFKTQWLPPKWMMGLANSHTSSPHSSFIFDIFIRSSM